MNIINSQSPKYYFTIMIVELTLLSIIYWLFFNINFASISFYILFVIFYITGYILWKNICQRKENLLFSPLEHYCIINIFTLLVIFFINSLFDNSLFLMSLIYLLFLIIFVFYYIFRLNKQKKSLVEIQKVSSYTKSLIVMNVIFLIFDLIVYRYNKLQIQLVLYIPILFAMLTFLLSIYKKVLSFKSLMAFLLFLNVYIISTFLLVLNYLNNNLFAFLVLIHSILFFATVCLFKINSIETDKQDFYYSHNLFSLLFANMIIIFISLNNILSFQIPNMFASYLYFAVLSLVAYLVYCIYKIIAKI